MTNLTLQELDLLDQLILTINSSSWEQLMILDPNNTVQPETTFTLSHKRAVCGEATCTRALIHSQDRIFFFFFETEKFGPAGLEQRKIK